MSENQYKQRISWISKKAYEKNSIRRNSRTANLFYGEISVRRNIRTAKLPDGEISYGDISYGEISYAKFPVTVVSTFFIIDTIDQ